MIDSFFLTYSLQLLLIVLLLAIFLLLYMRPYVCFALNPRQHCAEHGLKLLLVFITARREIS